MNPLNDILDQDLDPTETREWTESLQSIIQHDGTERAHYLLERMVDETRRAGGHLPFALHRPHELRDCAVRLGDRSMARAASSDDLEP